MAAMHGRAADGSSRCKTGTAALAHCGAHVSRRRLHCSLAERGTNLGCPSLGVSFSQSRLFRRALLFLSRLAKRGSSDFISRVRPPFVSARGMALLSSFPRHGEHVVKLISFRAPGFCLFTSLRTAFPCRQTKHCSHVIVEPKTAEMRVHCNACGVARSHCGGFERSLLRHEAATAASPVERSSA